MSLDLLDLLKGNYDRMESVIDEHMAGTFTLSTIRSRLVNGRTLLHQCSLYGYYDLVERLLQTHDHDEVRPLSPDVRDSNGATPLHLTKDVRTLNTLLAYGATLNAKDNEGNQPLHSKCLGYQSKPSELDVIECMLDCRAKLIVPNRQGLIPIHLAAT